METNAVRRIIFESDLKRLVPLGRTTRWKMTQKGEFPAPVRLSSGRIGYFEDEIFRWQQNLERATESKKPMPVSPGRNGGLARRGGANHG